MKQNKKFWLSLTIFSLMGQIAWTVENMYLNVFIYKSFASSASDISNMVMTSAITATLTTILIGALSDRLGKRKLFICSGYILWGISIFGFVFLKLDILSKLAGIASAASLGISLTILLDCLMTFFGSSANDAAFNAWLTDSTNEKNRGKAESINAIMPLLSILIVFGAFMFLNLDDPSSWTLIFSAIGVLVLFVGVLGLFIIKEPEISPDKSNYLSGIVYGFLPSTVIKNPTLYITLAAFIIFNISIQIFMPYLIIYYEVSLNMPDYVIILAPTVIIAAAVTAIWGRFYDKKGFKLSGVSAVLILIAGYITMFFVRSKLPVFIGSLLLMSGYLASIAVFGAMIRDNTPDGKSGRLQGARIFSQVFIPGIIGPMIGKWVLSDAKTIIGSDGTSSFVPSSKIFLASAIVCMLVLPVFFIIKNRKPGNYAKLKTDFERDLDNAEIPFPDYPRPQFKRDSYICLNGEWDFAVEGNENTLYNGKITVPFPPESRLSGVIRQTNKNETLIYTRKINIEKEYKNKRLLLHFGACDQYTSVFVNGKKAGENTGGYLPFHMDISDFVVLGENDVTVKVKDPLSLTLPYGKQREKRGGMWYTPVSGIWQTVWLEEVPERYIEAIEITPSLSSVKIEIFGGEGNGVILFDGKEYKYSGYEFTLNVENPICWTPENPHLYDFTIISGEDSIDSYFALRTVGIEEKGGKAFIMLNGKPYFFHGLLDQGYFSDGIFLPASERGFKEDILRMKECGFNMLRKHIKLEPDIFYYYCDKHGMLVFQDMINSGRYSFLIDTALPTAGLRKGITHKASKERRAEFEKTSSGIIETLYNHPSVVYYTIFNEGWGQFSEKKNYNRLKELDPTRIYDTTSGWFKVEESDVESDHIYFKPVKLKEVKGKPTVLSEFGGYACGIDGHMFNPDNKFGYKLLSSPKEFEEELISLYEREIIPAIEQGLCATVLTQVSDVEDEINGLLTFDRAVLKVDAKRMKDLSNKLFSAFEANLK